MEIKFYKTYNTDKIVDVMMHDDVYPHLKVDQLPSKEDMLPILKEWLGEQNNYLVMDGARVLGAITTVPVDTGVVEMHGGFFKVAYGKTSRQIILSFMEKLRKDKVRSVYLIVPDSKRFVHKLATDTQFEQVSVMDSNITIDGVENKVVLYRREI